VAGKTLGVPEALELFRQPPQDESMRRPNQLIVAMLLSEEKSYSEAVSILDELLQSATDDVERNELGLRAGVVAADGGDYQRARQYYQDVLKRDPDNWGALNNLAYLLSDNLGMHKEALPYAERAAILSRAPAVLDTLGSVYLQLGEHRMAIGQLSRAIEGDPDMLIAYLHLAEAYRHLGEFAHAEDLLSEAQGRLKPGSPDEQEFGQQIAHELEKVRQRDTKP
jgi:tetratricopeptide (TPR) repeat protein